MTEIEQLKHRLAMIEDDMKVIESFISNQNLTDKFFEPTEIADCCWTHFSNIEIACELSSNESLAWTRLTRNQLNPNN